MSLSIRYSAYMKYVPVVLRASHAVYKPIGMIDDGPDEYRFVTHEWKYDCVLIGVDDQAWSSMRSYLVQISIVRGSSFSYILHDLIAFLSFHRVTKPNQVGRILESTDGTSGDILNLTIKSLVCSIIV
jgi:hypothetical protein